MVNIYPKKVFLAAFLFNFLSLVFVHSVFKKREQGSEEKHTVDMFLNLKTVFASIRQKVQKVKKILNNVLLINTIIFHDPVNEYSDP